MKLRNKKTGNVIKLDIHCIAGKNYESLAEVNAEWEDYEEPKPKEVWFISNNGQIHAEDGHDKYREERQTIGNYFSSQEEAEKAVEKLKAWKRLKDKQFQFHGYNALGVGEIKFSQEFEDMDDEGEIGQLQHDLDLLFGGGE